MRPFFSADHHWGHKNIIKHAERPFDSLHDMNAAMVERWNAVVGPKDTVYHCGDIVWGRPGPMRSILDRLNGTIHLITGNHDKTALDAICASRFASISPLKEITIPDPDADRGRRLIVLCHYAMRTWNCSHWGAWHLYGHSHGKLYDDPNSLSLDVGVDCWDYTPASYDQIKARMAEKTWTPPHGPRK